LVPGSECACCQEDNVTVSRIIRWEAIVHSRQTGSFALLMLLFARITSNHVVVRFSTVHSFCKQCARTTWWRIQAAQGAKVLLFTLLFVALLFTVPMLILVVALFWTDHTFELPFTLALGCGIVITALIALSFRWVWHFPMRGRLTEIGQYPFAPVNIVSASDN